MCDSVTVFARFDALQLALQHSHRLAQSKSRVKIVERNIVVVASHVIVVDIFSHNVLGGTYRPWAAGQFAIGKRHSQAVGCKQLAKLWSGKLEVFTVR